MAADRYERWSRAKRVRTSHLGFSRMELAGLEPATPGCDSRGFGPKLDHAPISANFVLIVENERPVFAGLLRVELNGALSNPRVQLELPKLAARREALLRQRADGPKQPRPIARRPAPVLETVTQVLDATKAPMRARVIHRAAEELLGEQLRWPSVRGVLSAYTIGGDRRFQRVAHGTYAMSGGR
jgi:hypothetical protein